LLGRWVHNSTRAREAPPREVLKTDKISQERIKTRVSIRVTLG
jgi:hypothetical protein